MLYPLPRGCGICGSGESVQGTVDICSDCLSSLPLISSPLCSICGRPIMPWEIVNEQKVSSFTATLKRFGLIEDKKCCVECSRGGWTRRFTANRSLVTYDGLIRDIILSLKFQGKYSLAEPLGQLMAAYVRETDPFPRFDIIIPVPIHDDRLTQRGYNQAELMAQVASEHLGTPLSLALTRVGYSQTQSLTNALKRRENVRGCFSVTRPGEVVGKRVVVIDDIYTTGATLDECAGELLRNGAKAVYGLSVAIAIKGTPDVDVEGRD